MININQMNQSNMYSIEKPKIPLVFSALKQANTHTTTGNIGTLIPLFIKEMQPNEKIHGNQQINIQFAPTVNTLMHQIKGEITTYFVPYRLIWNEFEDFITGGDDGSKKPNMPHKYLFQILEERIAKLGKEGVYYNQHLRKAQNAINALEETLFSDEWKIKIQISNGTLIVWKDFTPVVALWYYILKGILIYIHHKEDWDDQVVGNFLKGKEAFNDISKAENFVNVLPQVANKAQKVIEVEDVEPGEMIERIFTTRLLKEKQPLGGKYGKTDAIIKRLENIIKGVMTEYTLAITEDSFYDYLGLPLSADVILRYIASMLFEENDGDYEEETGKNIRDYFTDSVNIATTQERVSLLPEKAYKKIYNDWIRLEDWESNAKEDGYIELANYDWDYFTRARKYQIRGEMPTIPVTVTNDKGQWQWDKALTAAALMNYYTANAKIRPRYREHLLSRWGVNMQDTRLQLSEFIENVSINITANGIVQTAPGGEGQTPLGTIAGQMFGNGQGLPINYNAQEHGILISILAIKPTNVYEQGMPIMWKKKNKFELPIPELANLPDVPIYKSEITTYCNKEVLGWRPIYDEYRTSWNIVTGRARQGIATKESNYTLARKYGDNTNPILIAKCISDYDKVKQNTADADFTLIIGTYYTDILPMPYTSDTYISL